MLQVADELLCHILSYLSAKDLCRACMVCREWSRLAEDDVLWKQLFSQEYPFDKWTFSRVPRSFAFAKRARVRGWKAQYHHRKVVDATWQHNKARQYGIRPRGSLHSHFRAGVSGISFVNGDCLAVGVNRSIECWNYKNLKLITEFDAHREPIYCLYVAAETEQMITSSHDLTMKLWDLGNLTNRVGKAVTDSDYESDESQSQPNRTESDNKKLPSSSGNSQSRLIATIMGPRKLVWCMDVMEGSTPFFAAGSADTSISIFSLASCRMKTSLSDTFVSAPSRCVWSVALCPTSRYSLLSGHQDGSLVEWDIEKATPIRRFTAHGEPLKCLQRRGDIVLTAGWDGYVKQWDLRLPPATSSLIQSGSSSFSPVPIEQTSLPYTTTATTTTTTTTTITTTTSRGTTSSAYTHTTTTKRPVFGHFANRPGSSGGILPTASSSSSIGGSGDGIAPTQHPGVGVGLPFGIVGSPAPPSTVATGVNNYFRAGDEYCTLQFDEQKAVFGSRHTLRKLDMRMWGAEWILDRAGGYRDLKLSEGFMVTTCDAATPIYIWDYEHIANSAVEGRVATKTLV